MLNIQALHFSVAGHSNYLSFEDALSSKIPELLFRPYLFVPNKPNAFLVFVPIARGIFRTTQWRKIDSNARSSLSATVNAGALEYRSRKFDVVISATADRAAHSFYLYRSIQSNEIFRRCHKLDRVLHS